jgi:hypothetical protein
MTANSLIKKETESGSSWGVIFEKYFSKYKEYISLASKQLVGLFITIFVKKEMMNDIKNGKIYF